ncbi:hypothetical protein [Marinomonas primoryensis]|jgi:hypothetical protein|uniref:hypothetical protein n=1 Tax=Marinomonas primoryensis TaxID=178399 RepID=UPI003703FD8A
MSDLATQHNDGIFEPDEETLMSALRNQDDIPILMDIVADQTPFSAGQEMHLAQSFDGSQTRNESEQGEDSQVEVVSPADTLTSSNVSQELIAKTIADVLEKRLPELVLEVMQALHEAGAMAKKE